jgi:hypothetical protein
LREPPSRSERTWILTQIGKSDLRLLGKFPNREGKAVEALAGEIFRRAQVDRDPNSIWLDEVALAWSISLFSSGVCITTMDLRIVTANLSSPLLRSPKIRGPTDSAMALGRNETGSDP